MTFRYVTSWFKLSRDLQILYTQLMCLSPYARCWFSPSDLSPRVPNVSVLQKSPKIRAYHAAKPLCVSSGSRRLDDSQLPSCIFMLRMDQSPDCGWRLTPTDHPNRAASPSCNRTSARHLPHRRETPSSRSV